MMAAFQKYEFISCSSTHIMGKRYWEEVINGKKRRNSLADKMPNSVKVLCPSCADQFRIKIEEREKNQRLIVRLALISTGIIIVIVILRPSLIWPGVLFWFFLTLVIEALLENSG